jgi:hypothetical protein
LPEEFAVVVPLDVPLRVTVAPLPPVPLIVPEMLHGQAEGVVMVMLRDWAAVCAGLLESFTCTVKVVVPGTIGVPVICPSEDRLSPAGNAVLLAKDQL